MEKTTSLFPGTFATNSVVCVLGLLISVCGFIPGMPNIAASLLVGLGSAMFVAGFLGVVNVKILANEVCRATSQPLEDYALLSQIRGSGLQEIYRDREKLIGKILSQLDYETKEIVIVGSSLKGLIGLGYDAGGQNQRIRDILFNALKRGVKVNILLTNPKVAHHRSKQEGRSDGDIESEIIKNLMYFVRLRHEQNLKGDNFNLSIKLYFGTPTIFLVCTSDFMVINPYPYYSTAYGFFAFLLNGGSDLYRGYYASHYQGAWNDTRLCETIESDVEEAKKQIEKLIEGKNPHQRDIIPDQKTKNDLKNLLGKIKL